jgi:hypothetical protein
MTRDAVVTMAAGDYSMKRANTQTYISFQSQSSDMSRLIVFNMKSFEQKLVSFESTRFDGEYNYRLLT